MNAIRNQDTSADLNARFAALRTRMPQIDKPLITLAELGEESLLDLVHGRTLALCIQDFIAKKNALQIAQRLLEVTTWGRYHTEGAQGIEISGRALFECSGDRSCPEYFAHALPTRRAVRNLLDPLGCPVDRMQAELDSAWKAGAQVLTLNGRKCHVGLLRCFRNGGEALPHNDRARIDFAHPKTARMQFQLALNIYLMTAAGGQLELWNLLPSDELYDAARYDFGPTYAIRDDLLPKPDLIIHPVPGDFILFNAAKIHRVQPVLGEGARVTVSAFAGFFSINEPLQLFS